MLPLVTTLAPLSQLEKRSTLLHLSPAAAAATATAAAALPSSPLPPPIVLSSSSSHKWPSSFPYRASPITLLLSLQIFSTLVTCFVDSPTTLTPLILTSRSPFLTSLLSGEESLTANTNTPRLLSRTPWPITSPEERVRGEQRSAISANERQQTVAFEKHLAARSEQRLSAVACCRSHDASRCPHSAF